MTDKEKEIKELKSALSDAIRSFTRLETLYKVRRNELEIANDKIAGLTGKCEALQKDNENLTRTLEESREGEKQKTRENELHEPKIVAFEIPFAECSIQPVGENLYQIGYECPICGKGEADCILGRDKEHAIERFKRSMNNYCPNCGARLKEVKDETPKD